MSRVSVNLLKDHESIDQVFLASDKQLRSNRQGNLYLQLELSDRTGSIATRMWNATEEIAAAFENGDYVRVSGSTQVFQGSLQMIAKKITKAASDDIDEADFQRMTAAEVDRLALRLGELLRTMSSPHLVGLAESYLADEVFMKKFAAAPAGIKNHHAYRGGLLQHVVSLMEVIQCTSDLYKELDRDLMLIGAFLHDSGKTDELYYDRDLGYTDEGQLLGHIVMAISMLDKKQVEAESLTGEKIPDEVIMQVKHLIVSHHGQTEFGSPTVPMTLEAVALHHFDNLDATIHQFQQLLRDDANVESRWTQYHHSLGRRLYKGGDAESVE